MTLDAQRALWPAAFHVLLEATRGARRYCNTGATTRRGASTRGQARHKDEINQLDGL